jgi:hypothetical protein
MTPEEIAREIVSKWLISIEDTLPGSVRTDLERRIAAALAASEQRGKEGMCPPGWHRIVCDQLQLDALRAQLQASEQRVRELTRESESLALALSDECAAREASERALERAIAACPACAGHNSYRISGGNANRLRRADGSGGILVEPCPTCAPLRAALASPGSPQEKGK